MPAQLSRKTVGLLRTAIEQITPQDWRNALFDFGIERKALDLMRIRGFQWADILPDLHAERFGDNNSYFSNSLSGPACRDTLEQLLAFALHNNSGGHEAEQLAMSALDDGVEVSVPDGATSTIPKAATKKPTVATTTTKQGAAPSKMPEKVAGKKPWTRDQIIALILVIVGLVGLVVAIVTPEIRRKLGLENAEKPTAVREPAQSVQSTSDFTWNFDKEEGRFAFLAMQTVPEVVSEPLITGFQAHGKNNLDEPIVHFSGFIRSDTSNETFPILLARDNKFLRPEETLGIPRKAEFDLHAKLPSNHPERYSGEGMNASAFLRQYTELTFVFEYDEKKYDEHFSKKGIWAAVENFRKESLGY